MIGSTNGNGKGVVFGSYVYNGSSTTSISFTDNNVSGRTFIIGSCQDAGSPISAINLNDTTITVNLSQAVTVARINYMAFS